MMIARHTNYLPGVFPHFVANEQIYDRHIEQANEMLKRFKELDAKDYYNGVYPESMLVLNEDKNNFYDFTIDDFSMVNYNPIKPQLKLELGI